MFGHERTKATLTSSSKTELSAGQRITAAWVDMWEPSRVMQITNVHEAKTHFSKLLERVEAGAEVIIGRAGKPGAKLVPYNQSAASVRRSGVWKGKVKIHPDFDQPDQDIERMFYGEDQ